MIDRNEINDFIVKVFNYYNGKINVINRAQLDINWANLNNSETSGLSVLPNIVSINPNVIIRYYDDNINEIKIEIINTIIHELYHTDQLINYKLYMSDANYNKFIEAACEIETNFYISEHVNEINNIFGLDLGYTGENNNEFLKYWYVPGVKYQRRYYHDHIFMIIDNICDLGEFGSEIYNILLENINSKNDIILIINDEVINICLDTRLITIEQFNTHIAKYVSCGKHSLQFNIEHTRTKQLIINIKGQFVNLMCKKV